MVRSIFKARGLHSTDTRPFNPHLTIAKVTNSQTKGPRGIPKDAYLQYIDAELGSEEVRGLELLSMVEPADEDGYYHCFERHLFEEAISAKTDQVNAN